MLSVRATIDARSATTGFKASGFNILSEMPDGRLMAVNTLSNAQILIPNEQSAEFLALLKPGSSAPCDTDPEVLGLLAGMGMLIADDSKEARKLRFVQANGPLEQSHRQLIIFPTEKCNFRCVYCYESFKIGKMKPAVRAAVVKHLAQQMPKLETMSIDWFGGEPLLALDVMADILPEAGRLAETHGCALGGHITTNGYFLTSDVARQLLDWNVNSFQITLDGPATEHDKRRKLYLPRGQEDALAGNTFATVMANIEALLAHRRMFNLQIRTNYDLESLPAMDGWIEELAARFGRDPRVRVDFCPIWADLCNVEVSIPIGAEKQRSYTELMVKARNTGLRTNAARHLTLGNLVCYAAKTNSMIIRANGDLAKCTVALDLDTNRIGKLLDDGSMDIDLDKLLAWTGTGVEEDATCQACALSPSCQGNACPLERLENGKRPCPPPKHHLDQALYLSLP